MKKIVKQQANLLDEQTSITNKKMARIYQEQAKEIIAEMEDLYIDMLADGEISLAELYKQDRYFKLIANINKKLKALGAKEIKILDNGMLDLYKNTYDLINHNAEFAMISDRLIKETLEQVWCDDGKKYSSRIWQHKTELQEALQKGLIDCVVQGKDHRKMVKQIQNDFNVAQHQAECIVRTELSHAQNKAAAAGYIDAGYTMYEIISATDGRTCDLCHSMNGKKFYFTEAKEGENFPPLHPNCRANIVGYREGDK